MPAASASTPPPGRLRRRPVCQRRSKPAKARPRKPSGTCDWIRLLKVPGRGRQAVEQQGPTDGDLQHCLIEQGQALLDCSFRDPGTQPYRCAARVTRSRSPHRAPSAAASTAPHHADQAASTYRTWRAAWLQHSYQAYLDAGEIGGAVRSAFWLWHALMFKREFAHAGGWGRADRPAHRDRARVRRTRVPAPRGWRTPAPGWQCGSGVHHVRELLEGQIISNRLAEERVGVELSPLGQRRGVRQHGLLGSQWSRLCYLRRRRHLRQERHPGGDRVPHRPAGAYQHLRGHLDLPRRQSQGGREEDHHPSGGQRGVLPGRVRTQ